MQSRNKRKVRKPKMSKYVADPELMERKDEVIDEKGRMMTIRYVSNICPCAAGGPGGVKFFYCIKSKTDNTPITIGDLITTMGKESAEPDCPHIHIVDFIKKSSAEVVMIVKMDPWWLSYSGINLRDI